MRFRLDRHNGAAHVVCACVPALSVGLWKGQLQMLNVTADVCTLCQSLRRRCLTSLWHQGTGNRLFTCTVVGSKLVESAQTLKLLHPEEGWRDANNKTRGKTWYRV